MAIAVVQSTSAANNGTAGPTLAASWPSNTTTGNFIVVTAHRNQGGGGQINSITDTQGNTYQLASRLSQGTVYPVEIWYAKNITGGTTPTVTITWSFNNKGTAELYEISGIDLYSPLDVTASAAQSTTTFSVGPSATTTRADELVVVSAMHGNTGGWTLGTGYSNLINTSITGAASSAAEIKIVSTIGAQSGTLVAPNATAGTIVLASFKAALPKQTLTVNGEGAVTSGWADEGGSYTRLQTDDGDTSRLYTPTAGSIRLVTLTDTSGLSGATITAVRVFAKLRSIDPSVSNTVQIGLYTGATQYWGTTIDPNPSNSYILYSQSWSTNPNTGVAWTTSDVDALQIGLNKINGPLGMAWTYAYAEVEYIPGVAPPAVNSGFFALM